MIYKYAAADLDVNIDDEVDRTQDSSYNTSTGLVKIIDLILYILSMQN